MHAHPHRHRRFFAQEPGPDPEQDAVPVHEDDVVTLASCALARSRFPELGFADPVAEDVLARVAVETDRFDEARLRASALRTMLVDELVRHFFARHPGGLGVALFSGLSTRFARIDDGALRWVEIDVPAVAGLKRRVLDPCERHVLAACNAVECAGWLRLLEQVDDVPTLLVAQGGLLREHPCMRDAFFARAVRHLPPGVEIVLDHDVRAPLRPASFGRAAASLEVSDGAGAWTRYPRLRFVPPSEYGTRLAWDLEGLNGVSRLAGGRGLPSVVHVRVV